MTKISLNETDKLFATNPFDYSQRNRNLLISSIRENADFHYRNNEFFHFFWQKKKFHPDMIQTEEDLQYVPFISVELLKRKKILTVQEKEVVQKIESSGTTGVKSTAYLDEVSLDYVEKIAFKIHSELGICSPQQYHYLCFTYDPLYAKDTGTVFTDKLLTSFTERGEVTYLIEWNEENQKFELNESLFITLLLKYSKSNIPVKILGFPAIIYNTLLKYNINTRLPLGSWLQTGGGWKTNDKELISKMDFRNYIENTLGILKENQRDMYALTEHGIPYVDCEKGKLRVPNYSHVIIRSPVDFKSLKENEIGIIQLICSYNTAYPCLSVLTTDYGYLSKEDDEIGGYSLNITGKLSKKIRKGCGENMLQILK